MLPGPDPVPGKVKANPAIGCAVRGWPSQRTACRACGTGRRGGTGRLQERASLLLPGTNSHQPISIDAAKLDYYDKQQKLVYSGSVVAVQGDSTLKASELIIYLSKDDPEGGRNPGKAQPRPAVRMLLRQRPPLRPLVPGAR